MKTQNRDEHLPWIPAVRIATAVVKSALRLTFVASPEA